jgi:predicted HTH domain antitoxin
MVKKPRHNEPVARSRDRKDIPLNIRVSENEKTAFSRAAEIAGVPLSAWMRERLRIAAFRELDNVGETAEFLAMPGRVQT